MYALANIERFIREHPEFVGEGQSTILERARRLAHNGVLAGIAIEEIFHNPVTQHRFRQLVVNDPTYAAEAAAAIVQAFPGMPIPIEGLPYLPAGMLRIPVYVHPETDAAR